MTNEQQSIDQLLEATLCLPPEQRSEYLDRICAGAPAIRDLVEQLIEERELPADFLATAAFRHLDNETAALSLEPDVTPRFGKGELIAGRFRVARFIARGGMGEVYEVNDQFLQDAPVALKIIRPDIAADAYNQRRFEQEVLSARRANHRHLCPIYDIFHCEKPVPPFLFLTMKLLPGESLDRRLMNSERIPIELAEKVCRQLVEGIEAIHRVGILHRDIKPNNIMLELRDSEISATIMDFGLARLNEASDTLLKTGLIAGTPGYLAPELIRGASPSPATDLYALGVVMHQVLTGDRPLVGKSGRVGADASKLNRVKAPIDLINAVTDFLSEDPETRCRAFERLVGTEKSFAGSVDPPLLTRRRFSVAAVAALCCLGGGSFLEREKIYDLAHPLPRKRFVALLNWPPVADTKVAPMLLGIIDTMTNALSRAEALDHDFFVACQRTLTEMKTPQQVDDVCESLGANLILATSGSMTRDGIVVTLKVLTKDSSKELRSRSVHVLSGNQFSLPELATNAAAQLLNVSPLPSSNSADQPGTENLNALAAFQAAQALMKEPNDSGLDKAIEQFKAAVDLDPHFANAHARLSIAYYRDYMARSDPASLMLARANAETALALDPESVEGHSALAAVYEVTGELPLALRELTRALSPDPSNSTIAIYQAQAYFALNRWQDAEDGFKRVLKARPNYWLAYHELGNNYSYQGKYKLALDAFEAANVTGPRNVRPLVGMALMLFLLGDLDRADATISRSLTIAPLPVALQIRADIFRVRNKFTESLRSSLQATKMDPEDGSGWLRVGDAYSLMKHHGREAIESYNRALGLTRQELQINPNDGSKWMLLALFQCKVGDLTEADLSLRNADLKDAIDIYSAVHKVRILELLGRRDAAISALATCLKMGCTSVQLKATNDLQPLGSDPRCSDLLKSFA